jgi:hypothetical protein
MQAQPVVLAALCCLKVALHKLVLPVAAVGMGRDKKSAGWAEQPQQTAAGIKWRRALNPTGHAASSVVAYT